MPNSIVKLVAGIAVLVLCSSEVAQGQSPNPSLEQAKSLYRKLQFADVVEKLEAALAVPDNTREQLLEIHALMGIVQVILENESEAESAFVELLAVAPEHELDQELSPKILEFFSRVKRKTAPPVKVASPEQPITRAVPGTEPGVVVELPDASRAPAEVVQPEPVGPPTSWYQKWWVWTAIGVVVAGASLGLALGLDGHDIPAGTLGTIKLGHPD